MRKAWFLAAALAFVLLAGVGCQQAPDAANDAMGNDADTLAQDDAMADDHAMGDGEQAGETSYRDVTPQEAKALMDDNDDLVVIDVSPHYDDGHLPGAVHHYLGDGSLEEAIPDLDPEATYLVYCHVESVSRQGAQALIDAGFEDVYRLDGDYSAWVEAGYDVET